MDYKEEYHKALERAKKGLPIDEVFPELKESEDERIIDDAIQIIRASRLRCAEYGSEADKHLKAIAYLEKQKYEYEVFEPVESTLEYKIGFKAGVESVKQKEQKPVDYEKLLLSKFEQAVYDCAWGKVTCKPEGETQEEYARRWAEHLLFMVRDWADDYIESQIEPAKRKAYDMRKADAEQPVEWSEEDEKNSSEIKWLISNYKTGDNECRLYSWLDKLKSLRPQPKQEWSEHQHKLLNYAISMTDDAEVKNFLKSLRSSWKPSEEQIDALEWMLTTVSMKDGGRGVVLKNLINDLKKL